MKAKYIVWIAIAALAGILLAVLLKPAGGGGIVDVDAAGADKARDAGAQVVDVREPAEFQMGRIPGAVNVPAGNLATAAKNWDRNATYVVYCATGARSRSAVDTLRAMGFVNIKHFAQGIQAYAGQLESGTQQSQQQTVKTDGKPVLIEFYTPTWPSCEKMEPLVEGLKKQYDGKVDFRKLNVDGSDPAATELANKLGVQYVPHFTFVNSNGIVGSQSVGEKTAEELKAGIDALQ